MIAATMVFVQSANVLAQTAKTQSTTGKKTNNPIAIPAASDPELSLHKAVSKGVKCSRWRTTGNDVA